MPIDNTGADKLIYISALEQCESKGRTDIKILDTNGRYSYGILQFQMATFNKYGEKYNLPHDNIYSKEQQELIALYMLNDGLWRQWYTCAKPLVWVTSP